MAEKPREIYFMNQKIPVTDEILSMYEEEKSNEEMINYTLKFFKKYNNNVIENMENLYKKKDNELAQKHFETGKKKYFECKDFKEALIYFNLCILHAEHPPLETDQDAATGAQRAAPFYVLAMGYLQRATILNILGLYEDSMEDILRANNCGLGNIRNTLSMQYVTSYIMQALLKKKAKTVDLKALIKKVSKELNYEFNMEEMKSVKEYVKYFTQLVAKDKKEEGKNDKEDFSKHSVYKEYGIDEHRTFTPPKLQMEKKNFPGLSTDLTLSYNKKLGRHFVASNDIYPGAVLVVDKAFAISPGKFDEWCSKCLKLCHIVLIPCPSCSSVVFCSEKCRNEAYPFHKFECQILHLMDMTIMWPILRALRILMTVGLDQLKTLVPIFEKEDKRSSGSNRVKLKYLEKFDSKNYRTIYDLDFPIKSIPPYDKFVTFGMALVITYILKKYSDFFSGDNDTEDFKANDWELSSSEILVTKLLVRHTFQYALNHYVVKVYKSFPSDPLNSYIYEAGAGLSGLTAMFSHSCDSNAAYFSYGDTSVVRAMGYIPKGTVVNVSYNYCDYKLDKKVDRQRLLKKIFYFDCKCTACVRDWHCGICKCAKCVKPFPLDMICLVQSCKGHITALGCSVCRKRPDKKLTVYPNSFLQHIRDAIFDQEGDVPVSISNKERLKLTADNVKKEYRSHRDAVLLRENLNVIMKHGMMNMYKATYIIDKYFSHAYREHFCRLQQAMIDLHMIFSNRVLGCEEVPKETLKPKDN